MRTGKELLIASKEFASEIRWLSWWHLWSTLAALAATMTIAMCGFPWWLRVVASISAGLVGVRLFIIYHDYQHGAILRNSKVAGFVMNLTGLMMLNPRSVWNRSHDHHHKNNSKTFGANIGSFPIMTQEAYASASPSERLAYAAMRHPLNMLLGYFTVFTIGMCLRPFLYSPKRHFDGLLSVLMHFGVMAYVATMGVDVLLLGMVIPCLLSATLGAYLFYAQHNFPAADLKPRSEWTHVEAALHSSSFISMGSLMSWFTGNIGYHHVHHLNAHIPFYRLPEAMAALEELQSPGTTSLRPRDVLACLRLKVWSPDAGKFVSFKGV